jgi:hypothetical protein
MTAMSELHTDEDLRKSLLQAKSFIASAELYFELQSLEQVPSRVWQLTGQKSKCIKIANVLVQRLYKFKNNWSS